MIGKMISHYKILEKLGEGGMGIVYKAMDTKLDRLVALKFLPQNIAPTETEKTRFIHEAKTASALDHPNICNIHEIDETSDGNVFIAMAFYEGETLKERIEAVLMKVEDALDIGIQMTSGLAKAHEKGIVHRDIKPANVVITKDGIIKILDFGLAKLAGKTKLTKTGSTLGTVQYMSPEQARGEKVDLRTDIWSLGVVFYEMITGRPPFKGDYEQAVVYGILNEEPEPLTAVRTGVPMELERIVKKALTKNPAERYQHADEMLVDLRNVQKESGFTPAKTPVQDSVPDRKYLKKILMAAAGFALLVFAFFFIKSWIGGEVLASRPIPIAVITFENQTRDTTYNYLKKVIPNLLITDLEQSKYLQVTTWERLNDLLKQMGRPGFGDIDEETGFELCRRENIPALAVGSVTKMGNVFATDVKVLDVETKKLLKSVRSQGEGVESILTKQVAELGREIAKGVGLAERKAETLPASIAEVTTTSMDVYRYFIRGRDEYEKLDNLKSISFLQKALQLDSTFAMAYLYLGRAYGTLANMRLKNENYQKAMMHSGRTSEKERLYIESACAGFMEKDPQKRLRILKILAQKFPKEKQVFAELGIVYQGQGMLSDASDALTNALALDPNYGYALNQMAYVCADMNDYNKSIEYLQRYASVNPGDPNPIDSMGDMYFYIGDMGSAKARYEEAVGITGYFVSSFKISYIDALMGDYPSALAWIDHYRKNLPSSIPTGGAHAFKSIYYFLMGQRRQAFAEMAQARRIWDSIGNKIFVAGTNLIEAWFLLRQKEVAAGLMMMEDAMAVDMEQQPSQKARAVADFEVYRALAALEKDLPDSAARCVRTLESQISQITPNYIGHYRYVSSLLLGAVLLAQGQADSAIAVSRQAVPSRIPRLGAETLARYLVISLYPPVRDVLARTYIEKGRTAEAIAEYERLSTFDPKSEGRYFVSPEYHYSLAKLYEEAGFRDKAIAEYEKLLRIWKYADKDIPELVKTKKALVRLRGF